MVERLETAAGAARVSAPAVAEPRRLAAAAALLLGAFLIFGVGFAQPAALHDAAHDGRHSFAFPCH